MTKKKILVLVASYFFLSGIFILQSEYITHLKHDLRLKIVDITEAVFGQMITDRDDVKFSRDAAKMRNIIRKELPHLDSMATDIDKLGVLRNWVNEQSIWGGKVVDKKIYEKLNRSSSYDIYNFVLQAGDIQLDCGVYTIYLTKLYEALGYEAYIYDMGKDSEGGHSVVLVRIRDHGESKLIVQDPTYNLTFAEKDPKKPLDFFRLLQIIKYKKNDLVHIRMYVGKGHRVFCSLASDCEHVNATDDVNRNTDIIKRAQFKVEEVKDNLGIFMHYRYLRYFDNINLAKYAFYKRLTSYLVLRIRLLPFVYFEK
jgi:hypothetical protein